MGTRSSVGTGRHFVYLSSILQMYLPRIAQPFHTAKGIRSDILHGGRYSRV